MVSTGDLFIEKPYLFHTTYMDKTDIFLFKEDKSIEIIDGPDKGLKIWPYWDFNPIAGELLLKDRKMKVIARMKFASTLSGQIVLKGTRRKSRVRYTLVQIKEGTPSAKGYYDDDAEGEYEFDDDGEEEDNL